MITEPAPIKLERKQRRVLKSIQDGSEKEKFRYTKFPDVAEYWLGVTIPVKWFKPLHFNF